MIVCLFVCLSVCLCVVVVVVVAVAVAVAAAAAAVGVVVVVVVVGRNKDWDPVENNNFLTLGILWCSLRAFTQVPAVLKNNFGGDNPHVFDSDV